jgi:hypothetical protein
MKSDQITLLTSFSLIIYLAILPPLESKEPTKFSLIIYLAILPPLESKEPTNCSQVINIKLSFFRYESK